MKKVAIITLHTVSNYGSCLQTYATQSLIERLGYEAEIIDYWRLNNQLEYQVERAFDSQALERFAPIWSKLPAAKSLIKVPIRSMLRKRRQPFECFRNERLNLSRPFLSAADLNSNPPEADIYCTGSDQVWNSVWNEGFEAPYYLSFAPEGRKRISFSASIGRESIDAWERPLMRDALSKYSAISVREESALGVLKDLGIDGAQLVLDPTLMLTKNEWKAIATMPQQIERPYVLVYQLNGGDAFESYVEGIKDRYRVEVVKVSYLSKQRAEYANNLVAPEVTDFLGLLLNASYVVTDSFHATAFSINCGVPFTVILPPRFNTRITSLLRLTHMEGRLLDDVSDLSLFERMPDFDSARRALSRMRDKSEAFLSSALSD